MKRDVTIVVDKLHEEKQRLNIYSFFVVWYYCDWTSLFIVAKSALCAEILRLELLLFQPRSFISNLSILALLGKYRLPGASGMSLFSSSMHAS